MTGAPAVLKGRKHAPRQLGDVCMLGLGVSGRAVAEYLLAQPAGRVSSLTVFTGTSGAADAAAQALAQAGARIVESEQVEGAFHLCIASPGIPESSAFYLSGQDASEELISEVELAWRESPVDALWVGITGTNGKTTTTALLEHLLDAAGFAAKACGNIGDACIHAVGADVLAGACPPSGRRVYVAEVSSYQLASIRRFTPDVGVFLGVTPDHLAWHGSMEAYADAKWNMLHNLEDAGGVAVLDAVNDVSREQVRRLRRAPEKSGFSYIPVGAKAGISVDMRQACGAQNAAFLDGAGHLHVAFRDGEYVLAPADALQVKGPHNVVNALAASAAALALGARGVDVADALPAFKPLEHRIEPAGTVGGVDFYNDSKATNVDATLVALAAFSGRPLVALLGGRDKMGPLDGLVAACQEHAEAVVVFGEAAERFEAAFAAADDGRLHVVRVRTFDEAFQAGVDLARPGSVVLLSPACASFDEFSCFEERGQHFKDMVAALAAAPGKGHR